MVAMQSVCRDWRAGETEALVGVTGRVCSSGGERQVSRMTEVYPTGKKYHFFVFQAILRLFGNF